MELPERKPGHHRVEIEEVPDEDADSSSMVAEATDKVLGFEDENVIMEVEITEQLQYSVDEATSEEGNDDEDAYGEEDNDEVEVLSVSSSADLHLLMHIEGVEELAGLEEVGDDLEVSSFSPRSFVIYQFSASRLALRLRLSRKQPQFLTLNSGARIPLILNLGPHHPTPWRLLRRRLNPRKRKRHKVFHPLA
jgi:hypothetical protein